MISQTPNDSVLVFKTYLVGLFSVLLIAFSGATSAQTSDASNDLDMIAQAINANGNSVLDDAEIVNAIQLWISQAVVPGANAIISDTIIIELIEFWITGAQVGGSSRAIGILGVFPFELTQDGEILVADDPLTAAPANTMVVILSDDFPADVVVKVNDEDIPSVRLDEGALLTLLPYFSQNSTLTEFEIVDANSPSVFGTTKITIDTPQDAKANVDQIITEFIDAARRTLKQVSEKGDTTQSVAKLDELERLLSRIPTDEKRRIATAILGSQAIDLLNALTSQPSIPSTFDVFRPRALATVGSIASIVGLAIAGWTLANPGPDVFIENVSEQEPVEGTLQSFTCRGEDGDEITSIIMSRREGNVMLVGEGGSPLSTRTLVNQYTGNNEIERMSVRWNSPVTGHVGKVVFTCAVQDDPLTQISRTTTVEATFNPLHENHPPELTEFSLPDSIEVGNEFEIKVKVNDEFSPNTTGRPSGIAVVNLVSADPFELSIGAVFVDRISSGGLAHNLGPPRFTATVKATCKASGTHVITLEVSDWENHGSDGSFDIVTQKTVNCYFPDNPTEGPPSFEVNPDVSSGFPGTNVLAWVSIVGGQPPFSISAALPWGTFVGGFTRTVGSVSIPIPMGQQPGDYIMKITVTDNRGLQVTVASTLMVLACSSGGQSIVGALITPTKGEECPQDHPPLILEIDAPDAIYGDGELHVVVVEFEDPDGDLAELRFKTLVGPGAVNPPQTLPIAGGAGQVEGELRFSIFCQNTTGQDFGVTDQIVLIDRLGNESQPVTYSYTCKGEMEIDPPPPPFSR